MEAFRAVIEAAASSEATEGADVASVSMVWLEKTESAAVWRENLLKLVAALMGVVGLAAAEVVLLLAIRTSGGGLNGFSKRDAPTGDTSRSALPIFLAFFLSRQLVHGSS